jgi:hypothetical protein
LWFIDLRNGRSKRAIERSSFKFFSHLVGLGEQRAKRNTQVDWPGRDAAVRLYHAGSALAKPILSTVYATKLHRKIIDNDLLLNASIDGTKVAL